MHALWLSDEVSLKTLPAWTEVSRAQSDTLMRTLHTDHDPPVPWYYSLVTSKQTATTQLPASLSLLASSPPKRTRLTLSLYKH